MLLAPSSSKLMTEADVGAVTGLVILCIFDTRSKRPSLTSPLCHCHLSAKTSYKSISAKLSRAGVDTLTVATQDMLDTYDWIVWDGFHKKTKLCVLKPMMQRL